MEFSGELPFPQKHGVIIQLARLLQTLPAVTMEGGADGISATFAATSPLPMPMPESRGRHKAEGRWW